MRCKEGDLAVFDSGPRADLIGRFVDVIEFQGLLSMMAGQAVWLVRIKGEPVPACDSGKLIREGVTFDAHLKPIRPPSADGASGRDTRLPEKVAA